MAYFVYILKSQMVKKSYVGISRDFNKRLREHNSGQGFYTKQYRPWKLIYKEKFKTRTEARKREKYLKTASGRREMKEIFKKYR